MKKHFLFLLCVFLPVLTFGQSTSLFDSYKIQTFSYHTLQLSGQDFLSYLRNKVDDNNQDNENLRIGFSLSSLALKQSPKYSGSINTYLNYNYALDKRIETHWTGVKSQNVEVRNENSISSFSARSFNNFYFKNERGIFVYSDIGCGYYYQTPAKEGYHNLEVNGGVGYGRIVQVRSLVQAYVICKEIGADLSDAALLKIAEVIEKNDNGYYNKFRDNSEIEFYKDIDSLTQKPEQSMKIRQILTSSVYKTSERMSGWKVKLGAEVFTGGGDSKSTDLAGIAVGAEYALPIDFNKQLYASASYIKNLDDGVARAPRFEFTGRFSIDHSFTWSSALSINYSAIFPKEGVERSDIALSLTSGFALLNSLWIYGSIAYEKYKFVDYQGNMETAIYYDTSTSERTEIHFGFRCYIL